MIQYIDKEKVIEEIKKLYKEDYKFLPSDIVESVGDFKDDLLMVLDNLSTVEEVDLEKEIDNIWNPRFNLGWDEKSLLSVNHEGFTTIAKHFYELGLKSIKGRNNYCNN